MQKKLQEQGGKEAVCYGKGFGRSIKCKNKRRNIIIIFLNNIKKQKNIIDLI